MTKEQQKRFVDEVLKSYWPRWNPAEVEIQGWYDRLWSYDYNLAKTAVNNLVFGLQNRGVEPPCGRIMNALKASIQQKAKKNEPILLYTIVKERFLELGKAGYRGQRFSVGGEKDLPASQEQCECRAMRDCQVMNDQYGESHVILYNNWQGAI